MAENTEKKEVKSKKTSTAKTEEKPKATAAKKPAAAKKTAAVKKTVAKPAAKKTKAPAINAELRYKMLEVAAYYLAEKDGFAGSPVEYWIAAELQLNK